MMYAQKRKKKMNNKYKDTVISAFQNHDYFTRESKKPCLNQGGIVISFNFYFCLM